MFRHDRWINAFCFIILIIIDKVLVEATNQKKYNITDRLEPSQDGTSQEEEIILTNNILPKQIFNDGKPFYVGKDPISGQLDFSSKKPAGIEPEENEVIDPKEKNIILPSSSSPNIYDFLNLPVKYSSSKFVYPLVSSSYANLKYQGNNKNYISNHKNFTTSTTTTTSPKYYTNQKATNNVTKLRPAPPTLPASLSTSRFPETRKTTVMTTSPTEPSSVKTTRISNVANSTTTTRPLHFNIAEKTTTRRKFIPTRKSSTTQKPSTTISAQSTGFKKNTDSNTTKWKTTTVSTTRKPVSTTASSTTHSSTVRKTSSTDNYNKEFSETTLRSIPKSSTHSPSSPTTSKFTTLASGKTSHSAGEQSSTPVTTTTSTTSKELPYSPLPTTSTPLYTLSPQEIYNTIGQNKEPNTISLEDLFNALAEEDSHFSPSNQGLDKQGNLMQPIIPSAPAPFTLQQQNNKNQTQSSENKVPIAEKVIQSVPTKDENNYVRYEVQKPNVMQYKPTANMNNIIISPGQNSASFVLGSHQSVNTDGSQFIGTVEKEPLFQSEYGPQKQSHITYGTVINEKLSDNHNTGPQDSYEESQISLNGNTKAQHNNDHSKHTENTNQDTQDFFVSTNIRFPNDILGTSSKEDHIINGHAQPVTLQKNQLNFPVPPPVSNSIVFPEKDRDTSSGEFSNKFSTTFGTTSTPTTTTDNPFSNSNIVFRQETLMELPQKQEVLTLNQNNVHTKIPFPQLSEDLTPPAAPQEQPQRVVNPTSHPGLRPPPSYMHNELSRKPAPPVSHRPTPDRPLPNILPQFRPNAKISNGHPTYHNKENPNIRLNHPKVPYPKRALPPPPAPPHMPGGLPSFSHRRTPILHRYNTYKIKPELMEANRRIYNIPSQMQYPPQYPPSSDRMYLQSAHPHSHPYPHPHTYPHPHPHFHTGNQQHPQMLNHHAANITPMRFTESHPSERHSVNPDIYNVPEVPQDIGGVKQDRLPAFEEEDLIVNEPPKPVVNKEVEEKPKLEPVVTLQMLKTQKKPSNSEENKNVDLPLNQQQSAGNVKSDVKDAPVYVVYPIKKSPVGMDFIDSDETYDSYQNEQPIQSPLDRSDIGNSHLGIVSDYQNTPFSVVREHQQEPILTVKNKPQTTPKANFPYPLEKPDLVFAHFDQRKEVGDRFNRETTLSISPRIVNRGESGGIELDDDFYRNTDVPIAIAYTPTESSGLTSSVASSPSPQYQNHNSNYYLLGKDKTPNSNYPNLVLPENRDTQTEANTLLNSNNNNNNNHNHNHLYSTDNRGQNYEKDFMAPFFPSMSLNSVTNAPNGWSIYSTSSEKSVYDKNNINRADVEDADDTTKSFDPDRFQPELQGGFKPIYPPGYRVRDSSSEEKEKEDVEENTDSSKHIESRTQSNNILAYSPSSSSSLVSSSSTSSSIVINTNSTITEKSPSFESIGTTSNPSSVKPTERKKSKLEASIEALLFGDDEFDDEGDEPSGRTFRKNKS